MRLRKLTAVFLMLAPWHHAVTSESAADEVYLVGKNKYHHKTLKTHDAPHNLMNKLYKRYVPRIFKANASFKAVISAKVIRANGEVEELGTLN